MTLENHKNPFCLEHEHESTNEVEKAVPKHLVLILAVFTDLMLRNKNSLRRYMSLTPN